MISSFFTVCSRMKRPPRAHSVDNFGLSSSVTASQHLGQCGSGFPPPLPGGASFCAGPALGPSSVTMAVPTGLSKKGSRGGRSLGSTVGSVAVGWLFCALLALQFGLQPFLKVFIAPAVNKVSLVLGTELVKMVIATAIMTAEGSFRRNFATWTPRAAALSALPAVIYAAQNYLLVIGYASMDSVTFNCLNQSKLVSTALFVYLLFDVKQSYPQMVALAALLCAGIMLQDGGVEDNGGGDGSVDFRVGVMAVLAASALSGVASAACQIALQGMNRSSNALTLEMAAAAIPFLLFAAGSTDPAVLFRGWTARTFIPVTTSALGGICVGQVTKHLGGIAKGFAIVGGLVLTGIAQGMQSEAGLEMKHLVALVLVVSATWVHNTFPPAKTKKKKV